ncbi:peptidoglycan-binding protein [Patescibacteria group bacterium]|nr:peptidoglycan-binding protein [Patescibacteria group bacterium]
MRGDYSEKIIELQKLLNWLDFYGEAFDGIYSNQIIESVYQYQLANDILTEQDPVSVRGYLGPSTRSALNASYVDYQMGLLDLPIDGCKKNDIECRKQKLEEALAEK